MNERQRMMARKSGKSCGYADGGIVGGVSAAIERVGRAFKTDAGKRLIAADEALKVKDPKAEDKVIKRIDDAVDKAEKGYADGGKIRKVMHEFKHGELHSGSKRGPMVKDRDQAIAIAMSEARKAGQK